MACLIDRLDHLVLTTADEAACVHFYCTVLGMALQTFGEGRQAFVWNGQKINLHLKGREFEPKALHPTPGALDLCFIAAVPLDQVERRLRAALLGHLRRDAALLRARARFLAVADAALVAEEAHPVQRMTAPVGASGQVAAPRTPDRRLAL